MASDPPKKPLISTIAGWVAMALVLLVAAFLLNAQTNTQAPEGSPYMLSGLQQRIPLLEDAGTNLVHRDLLCIPLSAFGRQLDEHLPPDARVFLGSMIGETNGAKAGYYFFLRNALFPRKVEISLDGNVVFEEGDWFNGIACDDPETLQKNGFDLYIPQGPNGVQLMPLTQKGVPK